MGSAFFHSVSVLEMLFEIVYGIGHCFLGERLAQMFRVILLEAAGTQVTAEQGAEARGEAFAEAVIRGGCRFILITRYARGREFMPLSGNGTKAAQK